MEAMRVLVADDHEVVRRGLCSLIEGQPGWKVAAEAADGREAVEKTRALKPDLTVMDISMPVDERSRGHTPDHEGLPRCESPGLDRARIRPLIREVLDAGARGYILKTDATRDLLIALEALRRNKTFFTAKVAQTVLDGYLKRDFEPAEVNTRRGRLTPRQREIVQLLAEGKSSKEVAVALGISVKTAETHRANIMRRLDCHSVSELVRYAIRNHIIEA